MLKVLNLAKPFKILARHALFLEPSDYLITHTLSISLNRLN